MPIQVIDNFEITSNKPIDNRFVVGLTYSTMYNGYATRFDIVNVYAGLRIWDLNDMQPYVYNGTTWSAESTFSIQGSGTTNYVPKFSTSNSLIDSSIYELSGNVLIGTTLNPTSAKLVVNGNLKVNSGYYIYGSGTYLTALNASEIATGSLNLARISLSGSSGFIMSRDSSTAYWRSTLDLTVGSASYATNALNAQTAQTATVATTALSAQNATALQTSRNFWGRAFNGTADVNGDLDLGFGTPYGRIRNALTIQLGKFAGNRVTIQYEVNAARTVDIPSLTNTADTFAFLKQGQTFTGNNVFSGVNTFNSVNTFNGQTFMNNTLQINTTTSPMFDVYNNSVRSLSVNSSYVLFGEPAVGQYAGMVRTGSSILPTKPTYTWYNDDDTGIYRPLSNTIGFVTNGVERMTITNTGIEAQYGIKYRYTSSQTRSSGSANTATTMTFTHNLGYIPIVNWTVNAGNVANTGSAPYGISITSITTTTVSIYVGTNNGGNATTVTVYCW